MGILDRPLALSTTPAPEQPTEPGIRLTGRIGVPSALADLSRSVDFEAALATSPLPVAVITTIEEDADGALRPHGTTVATATFVSAEPPLLLVSLSTDSTTLERARRTRAFGVNVLGVGSERVAQRFAHSRDDDFSGIDWRLDTGLPRLEEASGWVACHLAREVEAGDHVLLLGSPRSAAVGALSDRSAHGGAPEGGVAAPMSYWQQRFGAHTPLEG